jgi:CIC family chloride channel protein
MVPIAFLEFFLLTLTAYGSGAPGGLFAPCLVLGATLGYMVGLVEVNLTGQGSPTTLALVGMGAFFAGVGRVPLTAITITFELTASFVLVTPLMIACSIASFIGDKILPESLYDRLMVWNGINLRAQVREGAVESESRKSFSLRAVDVMKYSKDQTLSSHTSIADTLEVFRASTLRGLPVVDKGMLVGVLTQQDLGQLIHMEDADPNMLVKDLMTSHPVSVNPYDSLEEILFLFTSYKFTWLPVCDDADRFIGIISQSDVANALFDSDSAPEVDSKSSGALIPNSELKTESETSSESSPEPELESKTIVDMAMEEKPNVRFEIPKSDLDEHEDTDANLNANSIATK